MIQGMLYVVSAPSGAGKSSLIRALLKTQPLLYNIQVSISYTTRLMRRNEENGEHYHFITKKKFKQMIEQDDFLEYAYVFGNYYGTSNASIEKLIRSGIDVLLDIDWQGAQQIRNKIPSVCTIFILPPSKNELLRRLQGRGQDSKGTINNRMIQAVAEISHYDEYDYIIINDDFNDALEDLQSIIRSNQLCLERQVQRNNTLINKLLEED